MNIEDFCSYEQALTLKKLNFKEKCLFYYGPDKVLYPNYTFNIDILKTTDLYRCCNNSNDDNYPIDAPTLVQAQKWIRKKKNLSVEPFSSNEKGKYTYEIIYVDTGFDYKSYKTLSYRFNSYEEALSAGITESIKLIKDNS